ncbi:hypothetical protein [Gilliamella sp. wkB112]|uniref:hypothetical protein n=1 Tax=Gilliamella sp. wkB112 TaxID=3120257 RepID=UPI00080DD781|nr:hypothetical protein [Gilliamella apicola]OCG01516.1 hypothetical protein A9G12_02940 [Gilliamella apicola]
MKTSDTFDSIKTYVPFPSEGNTNYPKVDFDQLLVAPYNYWQDDDGDELIPASSPQAKGSLTVVWKDKYGRDITNRIKSNPSAKLSSCEAPYSLTVGLNKGEIRTKYGIPSKFTIDNNNHTYYIYPKPTEPIFCYAQPNLTHGDGQYAGPEDQWDPKNGFKLQDVNTPESNFPTVGGNNLFFKLIVDGITAEKIINTNGAIVQPEVGEGVSLELTAENNEPQGKVVRVKLKGPNWADSGGIFKASTFKIYADKNTNNLLYSFKINRWFIGHITGTSWSAARNACANLKPQSSYRLPNTTDYTNGSSFATRKISWDNVNHTSTNMGGLVNEWGNLNMRYYPDSDWEGSSYAAWTIHPAGTIYSTHWGVAHTTGNVDWHLDYASANIGVGCVTP